MKVLKGIVCIFGCLLGFVAMIMHSNGSEEWEYFAFLSLYLLILLAIDKDNEKEKL